MAKPLVRSLQNVPQAKSDQLGQLMSWCIILLESSIVVVVVGVNGIHKLVQIVAVIGQ